MENPNHYLILGVARDATPDAIKHAYSRLVRKHHPDVSRASDADLQTQRINAAYAVLGDAQRRAAYDALAAMPPRAAAPPQDYARGVDSQIFGANGAWPESLFAGMFGNAAGQGAAGFARRGDDLRTSIALSLIEIYNGTTRVLTLQTPAEGGAVERTVSISIPRGAPAGQQLRVAGQGQRGQRGGPCGDLLLDVRLLPDNPRGGVQR